MTRRILCLTILVAAWCTADTYPRTTFAMIGIAYLAGAYRMTCDDMVKR